MMDEEKILKENLYTNESRIEEYLYRIKVIESNINNLTLLLEQYRSSIVNCETDNLGIKERLKHLEIIKNMNNEK